MIVLLPFISTVPVPVLLVPFEPMPSRLPALRLDPPVSVTVPVEPVLPTKVCPVEPAPCATLTLLPPAIVSEPVPFAPTTSWLPVPLMLIDAPPESVAVPTPPALLLLPPI